MKTNKFLVITALAVATFSCGDIEESKFETTVGTATIEGLVERDDDLTDGAADLVGADGATIFISYSSADLSYSGTTGVNVTKVIEAATDADGRFSVEVPAISKEVFYTVKVAKFSASYQDFNSDGEPESFTGFHPEESNGVNLIEGETEYIKFTLGNPTRF